MSAKTYRSIEVLSFLGVAVLILGGLIGLVAV